MIEVQVTETINCPADRVLEFVMDPRAYAAVDRKIGAIDWVRRDGDVTEFRFGSKLPGLPGPATKIVSRMSRTPGERVDVRLPPIPANRLARLVSEFSASWVCVASGGQTAVTRTLRCGFKGPMKWLAEPILRRTLRPDVEDEMRQAKAALEAHRS
ncbi:MULTISPECIES: SRPBCC family protein [Amycolatopsis]|uniref:SRPBCC family protein n=1 Tax=Amycolatopsis albidoflavus TaxID=102226 RepID=A0ABW5IA20_9PSEU